VKIAEYLDELNVGFRIVALSATPGNHFDAIQEVVCNLKISKMEVRDETDPDVAPYIHQKQLETVIVAANDGIKTIHDKFTLLIEKLTKSYLSLLTLSNVQNPNSLKSYQITSKMILDCMTAFNAKKGDYYQLLGPGR
jgi:ERCC4-related helicase